MAPTISLPKLVRASGKRLRYQVQDGSLYLCDASGTFVLLVKYDASDLEDLQKRGCELREQDNLAELFAHHYNCDKDYIKAEDSGITLKDDSGHSVTWITAWERGEARVTMVNEGHLDVFRDYQPEIYGPQDPVRLTSYSYHALVFPVRMSTNGLLGRPSRRIVHLADAIRDSLTVR